MKKITILTVLVILTGSIFGQSNNNRNLYEKHKNNIWVLDTIYGYTGQTNTWFLDYSEIVTARNENGLPTIIETKNRDLGNYTWHEGYYVTLSYFDNDSLNEYKLWEWNTNTNNWNSEMSVYILYDKNGLKLEYYDRVWDNTDQEFLSGNKEVYTYDENNFLIQKEDIDFDWASQNWLDWSVTTYINNELGLCIQETQIIGTTNYLNNFYTYNTDNQIVFNLEQLWSSKWEDYSRTTYTYYDSGLIHEELFERFYDDWENVVKNTSIYDGNGLLSSLESHAYDEINDVSLLYVYTYNKNGDEITFVLSEWTSDSWTEIYKVYDSYDENFNQTEYYSENKDEGGAWIFFLKEEYIWNSFETATDLESFNTKINIYPNPASEKILIDYNPDKNTNIEIFTISGSKIKEFKNTKEIDVSDLQSGFYFIKISNQNFNYTQKIIIN